MGDSTFSLKYFLKHDSDTTRSEGDDNYLGSLWSELLLSHTRQNVEGINYCGIRLVPKLYTC